MEIRKKYSLLHPNIEGVEYKKLSENTCHDLGLDMLCKKLSHSDKESALIMNIISNMTSEPSVAEYRQKVFCDILKAPDLRKRMVELFDKFEFMRSFGLNHLKTDEKTGVWQLFRRLEDLNDYIICVEAMQQCLCDNAVESEGLKGFKRYIDELYRNAAFGEMKADIAALKVHSSEVKSLTVGINVNDRFEATGLGLISVNNKHFKKSGIVSNFAGAIAAKNKIRDGADWDGDMHYHAVEKAPGIEAAFSDLLLERTHIARRVTRDETIAAIADGVSTANSTFYLSDVANKILDTLLRKLRDTLNKYADVVIVNISKIIPEFVYYIRLAEFVEKYMAEGYT